MQMDFQKENSQPINHPDKFQKDSPINMTLNRDQQTQGKQVKGPHRDIIVNIMERINNLQRRIEQLQKLGRQHNRRKKKIRRKAVDINREYKCSYMTCQKVYGSKTSLKNHMKLKHGYRMRRYILQNKQNRSE